MPKDISLGLSISDIYSNFKKNEEIILKRNDLSWQEKYPVLLGLLIDYEMMYGININEIYHIMNYTGMGCVE